MEDQSFDRFDDNTFSVTISLSEYRFLVSENARLNYALELMQAQQDLLTAQLESEPNEPLTEDEGE